MTETHRNRVVFEGTWERLTPGQQNCLRAVARATLGWGYRWGEEFEASFRIETHSPEQLPAGVSMYNIVSGEGDSSLLNDDAAAIRLVFNPATGETPVSEIATSASAGSLVLAEHSPGLERHFTIGRDIDAFHSPEELIEKIFFYLEHPQKMEEVCRWGRALSKKTQEPRVSIIIFTYNGARYLREAIQSALDQKYENFEVIVVDDGSTDDTQEIIGAMATDRLRSIRQDHRGGPAARNRGIAEAAGEFIVWLGSDDVLLPDCLALHVGVAKRFPDADVVYGNIVLCDADLKELQVLRYADWYGKNDLLPSAMLLQNVIPDGGTLVRKECYNRIGGYDESFLRAHDYEWWSRLLRRAVFKYNDTPVYRWRWHGKNLGAGSRQKVDTHYEARVIRGLVERQSLQELFPDLSWAEGNDEHSEAVAHSRIAQVFERHGDHEAARRHLAFSHRDTQNLEERNRMQEIKQQSTTNPRRAIKVTYLISSILGVTGGNQTLLRQANALAGRGHAVTIVTYSAKPQWISLAPEVITVPEGKPMAGYVPPSDVVIATYFTNVPELKATAAPVKVYFAQGDQFIFDDESVNLKPEQKRIRDQLIALSHASYLDRAVRFVANSHTLADAVEAKYGRRADAILPVCVDRAIFKPMHQIAEQSRPRILVVGPDVGGSAWEPLLFKGIRDIRRAFDILSATRSDFTVVRMANSLPEIFLGYPCEFFVTPTDELKTFLYGTADILIYASHYDSCPRPPLEAMSAGAAVVCTATPGAREYCRDGENALLVPVQNPEAIAQAVERLLDDRELRKRLVKGGLGTASQLPQEREWREFEALLFRFMESERIEALLNQSMDLYQSKKFSEAIQVASALAVSLNGELPPPDKLETKASLQNFIGFCHLALNDLESAKGSFEKALALNPSSPQACAGLGEVFYAAHEMEASRTMFVWGIKYDPQNEGAIRGLARVNKILGRAPDDATLDDSPCPGNDPSVLLSQASTLLEKGEFVEALSILELAESSLREEREGSSNNETASSLATLKGCGHLALGDLDAARTCFEQALHMKPDSAEACAGLGNVFAEVRQFEQAKTMFEWGVRHNPTYGAASSGLARANQMLGLPPNHNSIQGQEQLPQTPDNDRDVTAVRTESAFARAIDLLFSKVRPRKIIESGTFLGTGTTTIIATAIVQYGIEDAVFYTIEVNPAIHRQAKLNLEQRDLLRYVLPLNGLSVPRSLLPTYQEIEQRCIHDVEAQGLYVDHDLNVRAQLYFSETNHTDVPDDLLGKCLKKFDDRPDFLLLDSGGHMGLIEFNYVIDRLKGPCYIALDDTCHVKHYKSFLQMQKDPRFEILIAEREKTGFCIARFVPESGPDLNALLASAFDAFERKDFAEALETIKAAERFLDDAGAQAAHAGARVSFENLKGLNYLGMNQLDEARAAFETALHEDPVSSQACAGLGEVFYLAGMDREAKIMYEQAVKHGPNNQFGIAGLAKVNKQLGLPESHTTSS